MCFVNDFRISANALLRMFSIKFYVIYSPYLILLVCLVEILGNPYVFTTSKRFYCISDDG